MTKNPISSRVSIIPFNIYLMQNLGIFQEECSNTIRHFGAFLLLQRSICL